MENFLELMLNTVELDCVRKSKTHSIETFVKCFFFLTFAQS